MGFLRYPKNSLVEFLCQAIVFGISYQFAVVKGQSLTTDYCKLQTPVVFYTGKVKNLNLPIFPPENRRYG